jgi:hypothetical protein
MNVLLPLYWVRYIAVFFLAICLTNSAAAQSRAIPFSLDQSISGVNVSFPATLVVSDTQANEPLGLVVRVDLSDLFSKVDTVVNAIGVQRLLKGGVSIEHKGTILSIDNGRLHAKVHLHMKWKGKILGIKSTASSDGSLTLSATPITTDNRIGLTVFVDKPEISNDIVRGAADFFDGRDIAKDLAQRFLDQALSKPATQLPLPPEAMALGVTLTSAHFAMDNSTPVVILEGRLDNAAAKWIFF